MVMQSREHLVVTMDHWKDEVLAKIGELLIRHLQCRLYLGDCCLPLVFWQEARFQHI